jgi:hypothetical protein
MCLAFGKVVSFLCPKTAVTKMTQPQQIHATNLLYIKYIEVNRTPEVTLTEGSDR